MCIYKLTENLVLNCRVFTLVGVWERELLGCQEVLIQVQVFISFYVISEAYMLTALMLKYHGKEEQAMFYLAIVLESFLHYFDKARPLLLKLH